MNIEQLYYSQIKRAAFSIRGFMRGGKPKAPNPVKLKTDVKTPKPPRPPGMIRTMARDVKPMLMMSELGTGLQNVGLTGIGGKLQEFAPWAAMGRAAAVSKPKGIYKSPSAGAAPAKPLTQSSWGDFAQRKAAAFLSKLSAFGSNPESFGGGDYSSNPVQLANWNNDSIPEQDMSQERPEDTNASGPKTHGGRSPGRDGGNEMHGKLKDSVIARMNAILE